MDISRKKARRRECSAGPLSEALDQGRFIWHDVGVLAT
jgi:hypothetical protein